MISRHLSENIFFIYFVSKHDPKLALASSTPDVLFVTLIFIYLLFFYLNDKIDYKFCILIISTNFNRISIFLFFMGVSFVASFINKNQFLKEIENQYLKNFYIHLTFFALFC